MRGARDFALLFLASVLRGCADVLRGMAWAPGKVAAGCVSAAGWCERTALPAPISSTSER